MERLLALFFLLLPSVLLAQGNAVVVTDSGVPASSCPFIMLYNRSDADELYACRNNSWFLVGPGAAGAASWSSLDNPTGNLTLTMGAFTSTFTYNATTGAGVTLFDLTDTLNNTGTGYIFRARTASGSAAKPFVATAGGTSNGVEMSTAGDLAPIGSGKIGGLTATVFGYLDPSSSVQTQLNSKQAALGFTPPPNTLTLTAGVGLSGGGDLSANRTFTLDFSELVDNQTFWDGSQASRTFTASLSGATDPIITFGNNTIGFNVPLTADVVGNVTGNVSGSSGSTTGNAATATALAADPADCSAGPPQQYTKTINASGTLGCQAIAVADLPDNSKASAIGITIDGGGSAITTAR